MACGGHTGTYTDANGVEWMGLPLWRLIGLVDDQLGHEVLIGAYNATLADQGYVVRVIAADGYNRTFTSQEVKRLGDYLLASRMNGSALPEQVNGKYYWPVKLVGANATGGKSIGNITEIRLESLPIAPPPAADRPWTLMLSGYTNFTVSSDYFAQGIACGHSGTYVDTNGVTWTGMPLWRLVGLVDDQVGHEDLTGAYNDTLADQGYNITVIAGDGFSKTFTSQDVKRSADFLVASKMNGSALPEQVNGKYHWPVKLVGANATGGKSVGNISEIRLDNLPIAPAPTTPAPTPTTGAAVLFDGDLTLKDGTFPCTAYNTGSTYQVQNLTPNGALELASRAGSFGYNVTDKKWVTMGTMLLDGAGGYSLDSTSAWAYRVNGVTKNDFSSTEGISVYRIADGDLVEFWYGTKGGAYENALAVIRARVHVRQQTTVFDGNVTLVNGTFGAFAYNSNATWPVGNLTVHGALEAAAAKGGFTYIATDKKWSTMGTFLLDGVSTFEYNKTENTAWAYTLNGAVMNDYSADQGISVQPVKNGDQLVFYFGVKGAGLDAASAVVRVRVFVANDSDFLLSLNGARNATVAKADFDASSDRVDYTDVSGTWSGIPLWRFAGIVDDADAATFNDAARDPGLHGQGHGRRRLQQVPELERRRAERELHHRRPAERGSAPRDHVAAPARRSLGAAAPLGREGRADRARRPARGAARRRRRRVLPGLDHAVRRRGLPRGHLGDAVPRRQHDRRPAQRQHLPHGHADEEDRREPLGIRGRDLQHHAIPGEGRDGPGRPDARAHPERHPDAARHDAVQAALDPRPDRGRGLRCRRVLGHDAGQRRRRLPPRRRRHRDHRGRVHAERRLDPDRRVAQLHRERHDGRQLHALRPRREPVRGPDRGPLGRRHARGHGRGPEHRVVRGVQDRPGPGRADGRDARPEADLPGRRPEHQLD